MRCEDDILFKRRLLVSGRNGLFDLQDIIKTNLMAIPKTDRTDADIEKYNKLTKQLASVSCSVGCLTKRIALLDFVLGDG